MSLPLLTIPTNGPGLYEFTTQARALAKGSGLQAFFHRLVPPTTSPEMAYLTHTYEGPDGMPAHIKAALLPTSLSIPVHNGELALGTWQGIYLFEHRNAPHTREVVAQLT